MRHALSSLALLCALAVTSSALAQPKAIRRRPPPARGHAHGHDRGHGNPHGQPPGHARKNCASQRAVLAQEEQQLDRYRADLVGIDAEIKQLKRRLDELNRNRADTARMVNTVQARVASIRRGYDRDCAKDETCDQYETLAASLGQQGSGVKAQMQDVRDEIQTTRREIHQLEMRIEPLRREYRDKRCNNLVPGETAQSTIDRCSAIFSEWNMLQASLNRYNSRLPMLKSRYEELLAQLRSIQARAQGYESYLAKNCSASPQLAVMRDYDKVRQNAETLGKELDELIEEVTRLRGIKITITPK